MQELKEDSPNTFIASNNIGTTAPISETTLFPSLNLSKNSITLSNCLLVGEIGLDKNYSQASHNEYEELYDLQISTALAQLLELVKEYNSDKNTKTKQGHSSKLGDLSMNYSSSEDNLSHLRKAVSAEIDSLFFGRDQLDLLKSANATTMSFDSTCSESSTSDVVSADCSCFAGATGDTY